MNANAFGAWSRAIALCAAIVLAASGSRAGTTDLAAFDTGAASVMIHAGGTVLWDYTARGGGRRHDVAAPVFSIDGRDVTLDLGAVRPLGAPRQLPNGCTEYAFVGEVSGEPGLALKLVFRAAKDDPIVRFRYEVLSNSARHLTKPAGADKISYLKLSLSGMPEAGELRLSEFVEQFHSYMPIERRLDDRLFADKEEAMGPVLLAGDAGEQLLVAYEHGSTAPEEFLHYRLAPDRSVVLEAVKGNYWSGEEVGPESPYSTLWFELGAVRGTRRALQEAYRDFVLRHLALSPASRQPQVFYNTWNYQERVKNWKGKPYLTDMNLGRMLTEIDAAHRMGIDVFVIDAGWFGGPGDWRTSPTRFPDGLSQVKAKLDGYGMRLGLWFAPTMVSLSSQMMKTHADCVATLDGKPSDRWVVWETEDSERCCVVSRYGQDFADKLIELSHRLGVTYFKFDSVDQHGCNDPRHGHGTLANSAEERGDCYAFQMPLAMARIAAAVSEAVPGAICDFDMTESGRSFGLAYLSAGKYFLINNGPYHQNYDRPLPPDGNWNLFFYPGPARDWICRTPLAFDAWIPSTLFLTHYLPDDPADNQTLSLASLILGQDGIWGDLPAVSEAGVGRIADTLARYRLVRDDMAAAFPVVSGPVGGAPEIHEKIARNGRGAVVIFAKEGTFRYVTENRPDHRVWHDEGTQVDFDASGHAVITATFAPEAAQFPKAGARIIFFGAQ